MKRILIKIVQLSLPTKVHHFWSFCFDKKKKKSEVEPSYLN